MRFPHAISIHIPEGVHCTLEGTHLTVAKAGVTLTRNVHIPNATIALEGKTIVINAPRANKRTAASMKAYKAHIENMFKGLDTQFEYKLQICHVHFPMTCKVESDKVTITNFLGEKKARYSSIVPTVKVAIKGTDITVSGHDIEKVGQTAANLELATKVPKKDRRVFQDGIFITHKPRGAL